MGATQRLLTFLFGLFLCTRQVQSFVHQRFERPALTVRGMASNEVVVALTREEGNNEKLRSALLSKVDESIVLEELPCIAHAVGPDIDRLVPTISDRKFDYIAITSPEAARVFGEAWVEAGKPQVRLTAVGKATEETLVKFGLEVDYVPGKATAKTLVTELPDAHDDGSATTLLYPASARAQQTLENGLTDRGFQVTRLNTYDTIPAQWTAEQKERASKVSVACFASPSAVKSWLKNYPSSQDRVMAACIGETSAEACRKNNWKEQNIVYPEKPGVPGWADAVVKALESIHASSQA